MSESLEDLVRELRAKKRQIREAEAAVDEAKLELAGRRKATADLRRGLEEIEDELTDPGKRRPLLAAAARPETADEHQRGPTAIELPGVELPLPERPRKGRKPKAAAVDPALAREIHETLCPKGTAELEATPTKHWTVFRLEGDGCDRRRVGTQIARTAAEAYRLAVKSWPGTLVIGEPSEHGPDCGCGSDVVIDPMAASLPQWSISRPVPGLKDSREMLGTVRAADEASALADARRTWAGALEARRLAVPEKATPAKPASKREPLVTGPMNQDDALAAALKLLPSALLSTLALGATASDDAIEGAMHGWPTRWTEGSSRGNAWGVHGSPPQFWYDAAAFDDYRAGKAPTLAGPELVAAVRRVRHLRKPRATAADRKPVRAERTVRP